MDLIKVPTSLTDLVGDSEPIKISSGAYGTVYRINRMALKVYSDIKEHEWKQIHKEKELCRITNRSPYFIYVHEFVVTEINACVWMDYIDNCLDHIMFKIDTSAIPKIFYQIMLGLCFLEDNKIVHMDIKPDNILITSDGKVKIADFNTIHNITDVPKRDYTSLGYCSPELINCCFDYLNKADVWAAGCILYKFYNRVVPFSCESIIDQLALIYRTFGYRNYGEVNIYDDIVVNKMMSIGPISFSQFKDYNFSAYDLFIRMMDINPKYRILPHDVIKHSYFKNINL